MAAPNAIPENVLTILRTHATSAHHHHMTEVKGNIASSNNIVRHSSARMLDEGSPANARAVDKILRLPKVQVKV
jgi:hypothetical protein